MQVILLKNMILKGRMHKAGEAVELEEEHAHSLQFMDLVYIPESEDVQDAESEEEEPAEESPKPAEKTASKGRKKAAK